VFSERRDLIALYYRRFRLQSVRKSLRSLLTPSTALLHLRRVIAANPQNHSNLYFPSASPAEEVIFCRQILRRTQVDVERAFAEIEEDHVFVEALRDRYRRIRPRTAVDLSPGRLKIWYAIVRLLQPNVVLETGVHDGLSSALILRALSRNQKGRLISIDLPAHDLPSSSVAPGWLVPDELTSRWMLKLGDSRDLLPWLAREYAPIDIFIHDSDHSREFQIFEYRTVKPFLSNPGLLLTDDADPGLLQELASEWSVRAYVASGAQGVLDIKVGGCRVDDPSLGLSEA
jgi:predicted O-methyltransferase YrrM